MANADVIAGRLNGWSVPRAATLAVDSALAAAKGMNDTLDTLSARRSVDLDPAPAKLAITTIEGQMQRLSSLFMIDLDGATSAVSGNSVMISAGGASLMVKMPTYAEGGYSAGGLAIVGEHGPELVDFAQPARVYSTADSRQLVRESPETVAELQALIRLQARANQQLLAKLDAVEARLAGIETKARLAAAA